MSDDAFRLAIVLALGIIAASLYALACSATLARYDRIERELRRA